MPSTSSPEPLCDIIVPIWNQPELTRRCLESVRACTAAEPVRLILVDNGSEEPARRLLDRFRQEGRPPAEVLRNEENLGFIKAVNRGIRAARAPWICLLNNDTIATRGWLAEMIKAAGSDPRIGLVNPTSNSLGLEPGNRPLEEVAAGLKKESGRWAELPAATGFCLLARKSLFDRIGPLDESYGMGNFDDDDLSQRVRQAGLLCVRACASYVYHEEKASFRRLPGWEKAFDENRKRYERKWGRKLRILWGPSIPAGVSLEAVTRPGHWICVVGPRGGTPKTEHTQVDYLEYPAACWRPKATWRLLTKRKKPFDLVVSHDPGWSRWVRGFRLLHRAVLLNNPDFIELTEQCQKLSHSPPSS